MYPFNLLIGPFHINNYELFHFMGLALLVIGEVVLLDKDALVKRWQVLLACTVGILTGTTGAKLTHLLLYAEEYRGLPPGKVFLISGHAYIGGAVLALLAIYILFRYYKVSFLYAGDYTLPFFGLFRAFGRIGCLLTGCCHGYVSNIAWSCYFRDGLLRHPAQAYMIALTFSIFVAGRLNYRRLRDTPGIIFFSSVTMYGLGRFFVEFFRVDSPRILGPFKFSHLVLIPIFLYGGGGLYVLYKRYSLKSPIAAYLRRLLGSFLFSLAVTGIFILTILSVIPKLNYTDELELRIGKGGIRKVKSEARLDYKQITDIKRALERYRHDNGLYPTQEQGLKALIEKPKTRPLPLNWRGPYITDRILFSKMEKLYQYLLDREGDTWSYRIVAPSAAEKAIPPPRKERDYILETEIHHALTLYKLDNGSYPTQPQGLKALIEKPKTPPIPPNWRGPYLQGPLKNKKGERYKYKLKEVRGKISYSIYTQ